MNKNGSMTHKIHTCFTIDYLLKSALDGETKVLQDRKGRTLTTEETIISLCKERAKGHKYVPLGFCNNRDKDGSCKGHKY